MAAAMAALAEGLAGFGVPGLSANDSVSQGFSALGDPSGTTTGVGTVGNAGNAAASGATGMGAAVGSPGMGEGMGGFGPAGPGSAACRVLASAPLVVSAKASAASAKAPPASPALATQAALARASAIR
jgi:hypothetical protein